MFKCLMSDVGRAGVDPRVFADHCIGCTHCKRCKACEESVKAFGACGR